MMTSSHLAETTTTTATTDKGRITDESTPIVSHGNSLSPAAMKRKQNKPLIERRRRARINDCLAQLKSIITKEKPGRRYKASKLEKADILELTVDYIKEVEDCNSTDHDQGTHRAYENGFSRCLQEIDSFLAGSKNHDFNPGQVRAIKEHCNELLRKHFNSSALKSNHCEDIDLTSSDVEPGPDASPSPAKRRKRTSSTNYEETPSREESPDSTESQIPGSLRPESSRDLQENDAQRAPEIVRRRSGGEKRQDQTPRKTFSVQSITDTQAITSSTNSIPLLGPMDTNLIEKSTEHKSVPETSSVKFTPIPPSKRFPIRSSTSSEMSSSPQIVSLAHSFSFLDSPTSSPSPSLSSSSAAAAAVSTSTSQFSSSSTSFTIPSTAPSSNPCRDSRITASKEDIEAGPNTHLVSALNGNLPTRSNSDLTTPVSLCSTVEERSSQPCLLSLPGPIFIIMNHRHESHQQPANTATVCQENDEKGAKHSAGADSEASSDYMRKLFKRNVKANNTTDVTVTGSSDHDIHVCDASLQKFHSFNSSTKTPTSISSGICNGENNRSFPDDQSKSDVSDTIHDVDNHTNDYSSNLILTPYSNNITKRLSSQRSAESTIVPGNGTTFTIVKSCKTGTRDLLIDTEARDFISDEISQERNVLHRSADVSNYKSNSTTGVLHPEDSTINNCVVSGGKTSRGTNSFSGDGRSLLPQSIGTNSTSSSSLHLFRADQRENVKLNLRFTHNADVLHKQREVSQPSGRQLDQLHRINLLHLDSKLERRADQEEPRRGKEQISTTPDSPHCNVSQSKTKTFPSTSCQLVNFPHCSQSVGVLGSESLKSSVGMSLGANENEAENNGNPKRCSTDAKLPFANASGDTVQFHTTGSDHSVVSCVELPTALDKYYNIYSNVPDFASGGIPIRFGIGNRIQRLLANLTRLRNDLGGAWPENSILFHGALQEEAKTPFPAANTDASEEGHASGVLDLRVRKETSSSPTITSKISDTTAIHLNGHQISEETGTSPSVTTTKTAVASSNPVWENTSVLNNNADYNILPCLHEKRETSVANSFTEKSLGIIGTSQGKSSGHDTTTVPILHNLSWTCLSPVAMPTVTGVDVPEAKCQSDSDHRFSSNMDSNNNNIILTGQAETRREVSAGPEIRKDDCLILSQNPEEGSLLTLTTLNSKSQEEGPLLTLKTLNSKSQEEGPLLTHTNTTLNSKSQEEVSLLTNKGLLLTHTKLDSKSTQQNRREMWRPW